MSSVQATIHGFKRGQRVRVLGFPEYGPGEVISTSEARMHRAKRGTAQFVDGRFVWVLHCGGGVAGWLPERIAPLAPEQKHVKPT